MALSTQPYKGARDFYPEDKRKQTYMFDRLRHVVEAYGYEAYDAPILEPLEIYLAKTGEEIVNEQTYTFTDRGGRQVVIRPEMTPTVSRMVAGRRQELVYPVRWYSIPNLWRYERPQRGRLREHWQLNVDIFGVSSLDAEFEMINIVSDIFRAFGAEAGMFEIRLNSRQLTDKILNDYLKLSEEEVHAVSKLIDRMHKLERSQFIEALDEALTPAARERGVTEKLMAILTAKSLKDVPPVVQKHQAAKELQGLLERLAAAGVSNACFDATIMRGFDYYTGVVFEVFDTHPDNNRSMLGGGRYDGLVGLFGVQPVPTVGFGWGDVTLANFLELHHLLPELPPETDIYVALVGEAADQVQPLLADLRQQGLNVAADYSGRKLTDQLKAASKRNVPFVMVVGADELKSGKFKLRDMRAQREDSFSLHDIAETVKATRP